MAKRIPVRIEPVADRNGGSSVEVFMELEDFESYGASVRNDISRFRRDYIQLLDNAKKITSSGRRVTTKERWRVCRMLHAFNEDASDKFEIINHVQAYSRDFKLPMRSVRTYLAFGENFDEDDVIDGIPYSTYAELCFRAHSLKKSGKLEAEKKHLAEMYKNGSLPKRDKYREYLQTV